MTDTPAVLADALVARLLRAGVGEVVVAPGSRNAPLAMALWAAAQAGAFRLHTRIDERTAGFLALGLTKSGSRAAVLTTSGTAVANLHPAVLEAVHAGVGLVVVSADRPARLRGTGANQTTDQIGIFGPLVRSYDVASVAALEAVPAPWGAVVHLNLQLDAPLVPALPPHRAPCEFVVETPESGQIRMGREHTDLRQGPRTVVVAGDDSGPPARRLAEAAGWPLLAEPSSGSRTGENALRTYRLLLETALGDTIERVVVFGRPTLSRPVTLLLERADVEVLVVPGRGVWPVSPRAPARSTPRHGPRTVPTTPPGSTPGVRRTAISPGASTGCWRASPPSRRTTSRRPRTLPSPPAGCWSWARPARSATSTSCSARPPSAPAARSSRTAASPASTARSAPRSARPSGGATRPGASP
ncbi:thiamine pyrophosphate-binding protein [Nocardioides humi]|uniref:thiamine pyrophosphate-binding protein n=1 Tax=Nocardioides humi TaxID=449461 RepID=UPI001FE787A0|nr:thiamine pyrophosphate-binding protein [Nocardioides humi]